MKRSTIVGAALLASVFLWATFCILSNWKSVWALNSIKGYALSLASPVSSSAQEELYWLAASKLDSIQSYGQFVRKYPGSLYLNEIHKRTGPKIIPAIQDLAVKLGKKSDTHWTDEDRNLNQSILMLNPNNSFALYLSGLDEAWQGRFDKAGQAFLKAEDHAESEGVSDLAHRCMVGKITLVGDAPVSWGIRSLIVVLPAGEGKQADDERTRILGEIKKYDANFHGHAFFEERGGCAPQVLFDGTSSLHNSELTSLKYWIGYDLLALKQP